MKFGVRWWTAFVIVAVACSSQKHTSLPTCNADTPCPEGFVCDLTNNECVSNGLGDASVPDVHAVPDGGTAGNDVQVVVDAPANPADATPGAPPDTTITSAPPAFTNQTALTFTFTSTATPPVFECSFDGNTFAACTTPYTISVTTPGAHTLDVRAVDASGQVDPTPARAAWTLDQTPPNTTITSGPSGSVDASDATFTFTSGESGDTFVCQLDAQAAETCVSGQTYSGLGDGMHTFTVTATDGAGNVDPTPATQSWTVALTLPDTMITLGPLPVTASQTAIFKFISVPDGATFECSLDKQLPFTACTSPIEYDDVLDAQQHTFDVRAVDQNGTDPTPAHFVWSVDTSLLKVSIGGGAPGGTSCATLTFTFSATGPNLTYQCALDSAAPVDCSSGTVTYTGLAGGSAHVFHVQAVQADGLVGPDATQAFTVDGTPPALALTSPQNGSTTGTSTTLVFTTDADAVVTCSLDGQPIASCASGATLAGLAAGMHTAIVSATDACANQATAQAMWTVDATGPTVTIVSPTNGSFASATGTIIFTASSDTAVVTCTLDGQAIACDLGGLVQYASLADGSHTFTVNGVDAFGNPASATTTFTVDETPPVVQTLTATATAGGGVSIQFDVVDSGSPVVEVHCVVDGSDKVCGQSGAGSIVYDGVLSAGTNDIEVYGVDAEGNSGAPASPGPAPTQRAQTFVLYKLEPGRAILIGQSFSVLDGGEPSAIGQVLAKAVDSTVVYPARKPRVLGFRTGGVDLTACTNALTAIAVDLGGSGTCGAHGFPWYSEFANPAQLASQLAGKDVLLIFDQQNSSLSAAIAAEWHTQLRAYVDAGGIVVILDGGTAVQGQPTPSDGTYQIFSYAGADKSPLIELDSVAVYNMVVSPSIYQADDPVAVADVSSWEPTNGTTTWESSDPWAVAVYAPQRIQGLFCHTVRPVGRPVGARQFAGLCPPDVTVFDKPFPGPIAVTVGRLAGESIQGDTTGMAVFMDANGKQTLVHADFGGNAVLAMPRGGSVFAAGTPGQGVNALTSFVGVKPFDALSAFPFIDANPPSLGVFDITNTTVPDGDTVRCDIGDDTPGDGAPSPPEPNGTNFSLDILALDGSGKLDGLCTLIDGNGDPLVYTTFTGVAAPVTGTSVATLDPDTTNSAAWPVPATFTVQIGEPPAAPAVPLVNGAAATQIDYSDVLTYTLSAGHDGLDFEERLDVFTDNNEILTPVSFPGTFPAVTHYVPAGFAQTSLETINAEYQLVESQGSNVSAMSAQTTYRNRTAPLAAADRVVHPDRDLLPIVNDLDVDAAQFPALTLSLHAAHPIIADGIAVQLVLNTTQIWDIVAPAGTTITVPALDADMAKVLAAYLPADASMFLQFQSYGVIRSSTDVGSYDAFRNNYPYSFFGYSPFSTQAGAFDRTLTFAGEHNWQP